MLVRKSDPTTKAWFEDYLKHAIKYRGVKTPTIAAIVKEWRIREGIGDWDSTDQLKIADELIREQYAEDKFAGILYMQKHLVAVVDFDTIASQIEKLFQDGAFFDWSTTDWFNVRVLSPLIELHGAKAVKRFSSWTSSQDLWQRRSAIVSLRVCVSSPKYLPTIRRVIAQLSDSNERFIQTGIGWVIADLSKVHPREAEKIVEMHFDELPPEIIRRHTKHMAQHKQYLARKRALK